MPQSHRISYQQTGSGSVVINDYENSQYYGEISLGNPAQNFNVIFDTGKHEITPNLYCGMQNLSLIAQAYWWIILFTFYW